MDINEVRFMASRPEGVAYISSIRKVPPSAFEDVKVDDHQEALSRGINVVHDVLQRYEGAGIRADAMDAGHGIGHLTRDYINALRLVGRLDLDPRHLFVGFVGGVLHDSGCAIQDRYEDSKKAIGHAEAGAILFNNATRDIKDLNESERYLIALSIAAHTHYLKPRVVPFTTGSENFAEVHLKPYEDIDSHGNPVYGLWIPRWVDRLDCNGPAFVARHFLTLGKPREEFAKDSGFYTTTFADSMVPLLRTPEEIKGSGRKSTMLEHLQMFASSQNNDSVYGRYDTPEMQALRDPQTERLRRVIDSVSRANGGYDPNIIGEWTRFLSETIEPTNIGASTAQTLEEMFGSLDQEAKSAWASGFRIAMTEYAAWAREATDDIRNMELPEEVLTPPLIGRNVLELISPN